MLALSKPGHLPYPRVLVPSLNIHTIIYAWNIPWDWRQTTPCSDSLNIFVFVLKVLFHICLLFYGWYINTHFSTGFTNWSVIFHEARPTSSNIRQCRIRGRGNQSQVPDEMRCVLCMWSRIQFVSCWWMIAI